MISSTHGVLTGLLSSSAAPPAFVQPYNYHLYEMGDSRTQQGYAISGSFGGGSGIPFQAGIGPCVMLGPLLGHKVRYGSTQLNAGGPGQTIEQILAYPRTGFSTIDLTQIAANEAAIVVLYLGTNNTASATTIAPGGTGRVAIQNALASLTNPATVWPASGAVLPLYGGLPKHVILLTDTPRGVAADNTASNNLTAANAAAFEAYATWLLKFDKDSGDALANSHVIVADTFHDPTMLDTTGTGIGGASNTVSGVGSFYPLPGYFADGLHQTPQGAYRISATIAARLGTLFTNATPFYSLPTAATTSQFMNSNPILDVAGNPAVGTGLNGCAFTGALIPAGTTILAFGTSGTTGTGANTGTYAMSANATRTVTNAVASVGAAGSTANLTINTTSGSNIITVAAIWNGTIVAGAAIGGFALPRNWRLDGSNASGLTLDVQINTIDATAGNEVVMHFTGTAGASNPGITIKDNNHTLTGIDASTALFRMTANIKYSVAIANSVIGIQPIAQINVTGAGNYAQSFGPQIGQTLGYANNAAWRMNLSNAYADLSTTTYRTITTPTFTLAGNGIAGGTVPTAATTSMTITLGKSQSIDATVTLSQAGLKVVTD